MFCLKSVGEVKGQSWGIGVTSVFAEENWDLEVAAGQDPEPCGTGAEWKIRKRDVTSRFTFRSNSC